MYIKYHEVLFNLKKITATNFYQACMKSDKQLRNFLPCTFRGKANIWEEILNTGRGKVSWSYIHGNEDELISHSQGFHMLFLRNRHGT